MQRGFPISELEFRHGISLSIVRVCDSLTSYSVNDVACFAVNRSKNKRSEDYGRRVGNFERKDRFVKNSPSEVVEEEWILGARRLMSVS